MIILSTKAKDNQGMEYTAVIRSIDGGIVLDIKGTPAVWYLKSLLGKHDMPWIFIDMGQDWKCININALIQEAIWQVVSKAKIDGGGE